MSELIGIARLSLGSSQEVTETFRCTGGHTALTVQWWRIYVKVSG